MKLIWIHEDMMRRDHPVFQAAGEHAKAVFIFDTDYFGERRYSLKRIQFLYECALDMRCEVYKGSFEDVLRSFAAETLYTAVTLNPVYQKLITALGIEAVHDTPFVEVKPGKDFTRFFPFWNHVKKQIMRQSTK